MKRKHRKRRKFDCLICGKHFSPQSRFERFCGTCREESPVYHFAEVWIPVDIGSLLASGGQQ